MQTSVFFVLIDCYEADDPKTGDCLGLFLKKILKNCVKNISEYCGPIYSCMGHWGCLYISVIM